MTEPVKIVDCSWHGAHGFELLKFPNTKWFYVSNNVRPDWSKQVRGDPPKNLSWVPYYEPGKYDLAILHLDQASVCRDGRISKGKNMLTCDLNDEIQDIPKIIINHGTPYWPEIEDLETGRYSTEWIKLMCRK